jgi:hypothetical protein
LQGKFQLKDCEESEHPSFLARFKHLKLQQGL